MAGSRFRDRPFSCLIALCLERDKQGEVKAVLVGDIGCAAIWTIPPQAEFDSNGNAANTSASPSSNRPVAWPFDVETVVEDRNWLLSIDVMACDANRMLYMRNLNCLDLN